MGSHGKKLSRVVKSSDIDAKNIIPTTVCHGSGELAVTSGMSLSAVKGTVGPREWGWGKISREGIRQGVYRPVCHVYLP